MKKRKYLITAFLIFDLLVILFGLINFIGLTKRAGLPSNYEAVVNSFTFDVKNISGGENIIEFDGKKIVDPGFLEIHLMQKNSGDTVVIKSVSDIGISEKIVTLPLKFEIVDLAIMLIVAIFYFFTGIFILLKFPNTVFSYVIHMTCISTGIMIIYDWGNLLIYGSVINFINLALFEIAIFMVPTLFLHFSFTYPIENSKRKFVFLAPFYFTSITLSLINIINLIRIFAFGEGFENTYFVKFHTIIADIFLIAGIILTIAKLEHSALIMSDSKAKKQIYWALLGISFGPLIYVFLRLIPRLILGFELVHQSIMEFSTLIAPVMLLISVTRKK